MHLIRSKNLTVVILAAGKGVRMQSSLPKVLHPIAKKPMLSYLLETAQLLNPDKILVVHAQSQISQPIFDFIVRFQENHKINNIALVEQPVQLGTGDAVSKALAFLDLDNPDERVLILCGDAPLIGASTLERLINLTPRQGLGLLTAHLENPTGLGRIIRNAAGEIQGIVEEKDATQAQKNIREINSGLFLASAKHLAKWLPLLTNDNASKEYYLTDLVKLAVQQGMEIISCEPQFVEEILGVNDRIQQIVLERFYQKKLAQTYLKQGVWIADPARFDLRGHLTVKSGVCIDVNVVLEGTIILGENTSIAPNCILINCELGDNVQILANSYLENTKIGDHCTIGPFARLRPGSQLAPGAKIGNFVEIKNSVIGPQSKINHLSYIGDSEIGARVNVGAGTITCNYDGANKYKTIIEDDVHIGSDTQLIAPVRIGRGATIAAGSTVIQDVPANKLTLTQNINQRTKENWQRPVKIEILE